MKNKAPLPLMEQLIMVLVFALTAALCLQGFTLANRMSHRQEARDRAVLEVQNAAEVLKHNAGDYEAAAAQLGGTWDGQTWSIYYDDSWQMISAAAGGQPSVSSAAYILQASPAPSDNPLLGLSNVRIFDQDEVLFVITAAWQEVDAHDIQ